MKKFFFITLALFVILPFLSAKPKFVNGRKYLIGNLGASDLGSCGFGNNTYNLGYFVDIDPETVEDTHLWTVKEEQTGMYSFKNIENGKYIKYDNSKAQQREALVFVDALEVDNSTLFTVTLSGKSQSHYILASAIDSRICWQRRGPFYDGINPIGVYNTNSNDNNSNFIFYDIDGNKVEDDGKIPISLPVSTQSLGSSLSSYLSSLTFNDKVPVVSNSSKELFLTIMPNKMGSNNEFTVNFTWKGSTYNLYIGGRIVPNGTNYNFLNVTGDGSTSFEIRSGTSKLYTGSIKFSTHPLIQLYSDQTITSTYNLGRIVVTEPNKNIAAEIMLSNIRVRGATASGKPKKSYAIKLKDTDGQEPAYRSYLGLREDNNWILDAMYIDPSRARNRVTTDLWVDFSEKPYYFVKEPKLINGTRGTYVEVFLNDSYNGLYMMTEKVDRKQLNLKKFVEETDTTTLKQRGGLYKTSTWSNSTLLGNTNYNWSKDIPKFSNYSETWDGYEVKYPDFGDGEPIEWKAIYDAVIMSSPQTESSDFSRDIAKYYDLPVFRDYYLLLDLILATDNHGKNIYFSVYDQSVSPMITLTPWDMDGTWGRRWDGSDYLTGANQNFESFILKNEHMQNNLYIRLKNSNLSNWNTKLADRYRELRANYFNVNNLVGRFEQKYAEIQLSDAINREADKWTGSSIHYEIEFLSNWIKSRIAFLDNQYLGGPYVEIPNSIDPIIPSKIYITPNPAKECITLMQLNINIPVSIVNLQGKEVLTLKADQTTQTFDISTLKQGVYLIKNGNSIAKLIKQ